ncbi:hypothetical protein [Endozoicomonas sp.]|uniref:hypothetical protein n=1 Tax=Endozoicomonas sp. TaxID=1892382 RepID=UPI003AF8631E
MPFPHLSNSPSAYLSGTEVPSPSAAPRSKSGNTQNQLPLSYQTSLPGITTPYPPKQTDISSRGILAASTVPGHYLPTPQMTGQPFAAMGTGNPSVPAAISFLQQAPCSMNTLPYAREPDIYDQTCPLIPGPSGAILLGPPHETALLTPFHGGAASQMCQLPNTVPPNYINPHQNFLPVPSYQTPVWPSSGAVEFLSHEKERCQGLEGKTDQPEMTMMKGDRGTAIPKTCLDPEAAEFVPKALQGSQKQTAHTDCRQEEKAFDSSKGEGCLSRKLLAKNKTPNTRESINTEDRKPPVSDSSGLLQRTPDKVPTGGHRDAGIYLESGEESSGALQLAQVEHTKANEPDAEITPLAAPEVVDSPGMPISVQQVLQLRHPGDVRKTPYSLKLLYLSIDCFDFHQKIRPNEGFDEKGNRIKFSKSELKKQHRELQNQLRESGSLVQLPPLHKMQAVPSSKVLLTRPTTHANIHPLSRQLSHAAAVLDPVKFTEREKVRTSLAALLASHKSSADDISHMKKMAKTTEAREHIKRLETDDLWNLDVTIMYYYAFFEPKVFHLEAPFIPSVQTLYCRPQLSNQPFIKHGSKIFELGAEEQAFFEESLDNQIADNQRMIYALGKCLPIKLKQQAGEGQPANVPKTFSRQCIEWHIQLTCDLVYKMIKLGEDDTQSNRERLVDTLDNLLNSISTLSEHISEFPDEFKMATESLCFLLQSEPLRRLLVLQEAKVPDDTRQLWHNSVKQLENAVLMILVKSLHYPQLLNTAMCLLKTLSDHEMLLTAQANGSKVFIIRLAIVSSQISGNLLKTLKSHYLKDISDHEQFVQQLKTCCSILRDVHQKIVQKASPDHIEQQKFSDCVKGFNEACNTRLDEIEQEREQNLKELMSEKKYENQALVDTIKKVKQPKEKYQAREKRNHQLKEEVTQWNSGSLESKELESSHAQLVNEISGRLQLLSKRLEQGEDYENELNMLDSEFPEAQQSPVLAVWVYGDIAYNLCNKCSDKFKRAAVFAKKFEEMRSFCAAALEEAAKQPKTYDSKWLYDRNPEQPISINSIQMLLKISDPEHIQTLIRRASESVSLYEKALARAKDAVHQLTQDRIVGAVNAETEMQMYHLQQRVTFIIDEMNDARQYLKELQPVPNMPDLLEKRKALFRTIKTRGGTGEQTEGSADSQAKEVKDTVYESLLKKSEGEWKVDSSVCDMLNAAEKKLEKAIEGFTKIKVQLESGAS